MKATCLGLDAQTERDASGEVSSSEGQVFAISSHLPFPADNKWLALRFLSIQGDKVAVIKTFSTKHSSSIWHISMASCQFTLAST